MNVLTTKYEDEFDKSLPHQDYPRPNLVRDSYINLNGEWDFSVSSSEPQEYDEKIIVPFPPESRLSGINRSHKDNENLYYRRFFTLPESFKKDSIILHFGAVDQIASVYINGSLIGKNEGGYIPFSFDISDLLKDGENELKLTVKDSLSKLYPYGKQKKKRGGMWYTPVSGIWQTVWLESVPRDYIRDVKITPSCDAVKISVVGGTESKRITLRDSGEVFDFTGDEITISPRKIINWTPENPYLYYFTLESGEDSVDSYFALREISLENGKMLLNRKPYIFMGLLDQGYYPDGIFLPATSEGYIDDIKNAKALSFNMLRKHIKIEPLIFYYLCDKLGIAVFQDMVNNSDYSFLRDTAFPTVLTKKRSDKKLHKNPVSRKNFRDTMKKTIELLYSFPSVVYYTIFNEGWGQFTADAVYEEAKALDGSRIYDATSGWFWQNKSDVDSHHVYFKRLDVIPSAERPTVISEFGGYSYRCEGHLFGKRNYGYRSFETREEFEDAVVELYEREVAPLIKIGVSAFVYTQLSDVEDETNGFLTYDRRIMKLDAERLSNTIKKAMEISK